MKATTVEERLTRIEREFDELKHQVLELKPRAKSWRQTVGAIPDDVLSRSTEKLGREWREQANKDRADCQMARRTGRLILRQLRFSFRPCG